MNVKFKDWGCVASFHRYTDGLRLAITLVADDNEEIPGERIAMATVNLPHINMAPDEVAIKDYSEGKGMLDALIAANIIHAPERYVPSGFVDIPICRLTEAALLTADQV